MLGNSHATAPTSQCRTLCRKCSTLLSVSSRGSTTAPNTALTVPGDMVTLALHALSSMLAGNGLPCSNYGTLQSVAMEARVV